MGQQQEVAVELSMDLEVDSEDVELVEDHNAELWDHHMRQQQEVAEELRDYHMGQQQEVAVELSMDLEVDSEDLEELVKTTMLSCGIIIWGSSKKWLWNCPWPWRWTVRMLRSW
jgi:hypothetical protein